MSQAHPKDLRYESKCNECGVKLAGVGAYLYASPKVRLCIACVTRLQARNGVPGLLADFITWYEAQALGLEAVLEAIQAGRLDARLEQVLSIAHQRKQARRGVAGFGAD